MAAPDPWAEWRAREHDRVVPRRGSRIRAAPEGYRAVLQVSFESAWDAETGAELEAKPEGDIWWRDFTPMFNAAAEEVYQQGRLIGVASEYLWDFERMLQRRGRGSIRRIRRLLREVSTTP